MKRLSFQFITMMALLVLGVVTIIVGIITMSETKVILGMTFGIMGWCMSISEDIKDLQKDTERHWDKVQNEIRRRVGKP